MAGVNHVADINGGTYPQRGTVTGRAQMQTEMTYSSYGGVKSATTTVTAQVEAIPTGGSRLRIKNRDNTNYMTIGFGATEADARAMATAGVIRIDAGETDKMGVPPSAAFWAWLGNTGTVSFHHNFGA